MKFPSLSYAPDDKEQFIIKYDNSALNIAVSTPIMLALPPSSPVYWVVVVGFKVNPRKSLIVKSALPKQS